MNRLIKYMRKTFLAIFFMLANLTTSVYAFAVVTAAISVAELIDKITILEIKMERFRSKEKIKNVKTELDSLYATYKQSITPSSELENLTKKLRKINNTLWELEDIRRENEKRQKFDDEFIKVERKVYLNNDERGRIKRAINQVTGSQLIEEKSYQDYTSTKNLQNMKKIARFSQPVKAGETAITTEVSVGELIDKITILEIKMERITDTHKQENIHRELKALYTTYSQLEIDDKIKKLKKELRATNEKMWNIQDAMRKKENAQCFDDEFIELARSVFYTNDDRCALKSTINNLIGSRLVEEKEYPSYRNK